MGKATRGRGRGRSTDGLPPTGVLFAILGVPLILATLGWGLRLQQRLPNLLREDIEPNALLPGTHSAEDPSIVHGGDWFRQTVGDSTSLVTTTPGSSMTFQFHGTDLLVVARVGPESGRLYVAVDGQPVSGLRSDENGSYVRLRANQAVDKLMPLAEGLAPGKHSITVTAQEPGSVAITSFEVTAANPFPWASEMMEIACAALLFLLLRHLAISLGQSSRDGAGAGSPTL